MKNWEINRYRADEAMYVHLHGRRQIAWGRSPSLSFKDILNPQQAFIHATAEVLSRDHMRDPLVIDWETECQLQRIHTGEEHRRILLGMPKSKRRFRTRV